MKNSTKKQTIERLQAALLDALDENKALKMQCDGRGEESLTTRNTNPIENRLMPVVVYGASWVTEGYCVSDKGDPRYVSADVGSSDVTVMIQQDVPLVTAVGMLRRIADHIERSGQILTDDTPPALSVNDDPFFDDRMPPTVLPFTSQHLKVYQ